MTIIVMMIMKMINNDESGNILGLVVETYVTISFDDRSEENNFQNNVGFVSKGVGNEILEVI